MGVENYSGHFGNFRRALKARALWIVRFLTQKLQDSQHDVHEQIQEIHEEPPFCYVFGYIFNIICSLQSKGCYYPVCEFLRPPTRRCFLFRAR